MGIVPATTEVPSDCLKQKTISGQQTQGPLQDTLLADTFGPAENPLSLIPSSPNHSFNLQSKAEASNQPDPGDAFRTRIPKGMHFFTWASYFEDSQ